MQVHLNVDTIDYTNSTNGMPRYATAKSAHDSWVT